MEIAGISEKVKLIVLVGPNGSGKTSLFEAFNHWDKLAGYGNTGGEDYAVKRGHLQLRGVGSKNESRLNSSTKNRGRRESKADSILGPHTAMNRISQSREKGSGSLFREG